MAEDTNTAVSVLVGVKMRADEVAEIREALDLLRRRTGRRVTQSDIVREATLRHVRQVVARERAALSKAA